METAANKTPPPRLTLDRSIGPLSMFAGLAAVVASGCRVGSFILSLVGLGGTWLISPWILLPRRPHLGGPIRLDLFVEV